MNATVPEQPRIFARPVAVRIGEALLISFAVVILLAGLDQAHRKQLESFQEVTAVGDRSYFQLPGGFQKPFQPVVSFRGQSLTPTSTEPFKIRDTKMIRLGRDDSGRYFVYTSREPIPPAEGEVEAKGEKFFFLKLEPGEYLKARGAGAGK